MVTNATNMMTQGPFTSTRVRLLTASSPDPELLDAVPYIEAVSR
jgi:hypothetical protein